MRLHDDGQDPKGDQESLSLLSGHFQKNKNKKMAM